MKTFTHWLLKGGTPKTGPAKWPSTTELAEFLEEIILEWTGLSTVPVGRPVAGPAELELEYSVQVHSVQGCRLVLRARRELAAELAHAATGDPGARLDAEAAFRELCRQVAQRLADTSRASQGSEPQLSRPEQWPSRPPDSESVILVGYWPLEARLWADATQTGL